MARLVLDFHPTVGREIADAIAWYLERSEAAADEFIYALDDALDQIATDPDRAAIYMYGRRAVRIGQFPYVVIYRRHKSGIRVSAVAHTSRRPGYWKNRRFKR
ncbi:MAG: type II toxin-antitoxin system RelE/ParE family toxin [Pirellulales bacterium]